MVKVGIELLVLTCFHFPQIWGPLGSGYASLSPFIFLAVTFLNMGEVGRSNFF
jgi:hypothetical protein